MSLKNIELPKYTLGEELVSAISHGIGSLLSIAALVVGVVFAALYGDAWCIVSMTLYGAMLVILYTMSTIYHGLRPNNGKRVFRIIDHCSVFLLIAGTYTPLTLVSLHGVIGWTLFGVVWAAAIVGIVLNAVNINKYKVFSLVCYIAMGWVILFAFKPLMDRMAPTGIWLLLSGGIFYTIGAVLYAVGKKKKYVHSVWHFFVLAGSILHYFSILLYVIPRA